MRKPLVYLVWYEGHYHCLPIDGSDGAGLYQTLPPHLTGPNTPNDILINTHTMITGIILYSLIVGLLAWAAHIKADMDRYK